jgi:hypothetical protein
VLGNAQRDLVILIEAIKSLTSLFDFYFGQITNEKRKHKAKVESLGFMLFLPLLLNVNGWDQLTIFLQRLSPIE